MKFMHEIYRLPASLTALVGWISDTPLAQTLFQSRGNWAERVMIRVQMWCMAQSELWHAKEGQFGNKAIRFLAPNMAARCP